MYKKQSQLEGVIEKYHLDQFVTAVKSSASMIEIVKKKSVVVVDVYADWCGPCRNLAPKYEALANKHKNHAVFLKINLNDIEDPDLKMEITALPTFLIFRNDGQRISRQKETGINIDQLEQFITESG